ncbi:pentapeptide repeat-containing protein [Streptomyces sp. AK02-01A]|uniref:pentapeptide repeat-containing protein n=1 Tax=Streptomyces sp. AK02-01A TaxID=3028648 RepID=UPI0029A01BCE|nr:pentapeptide repeat-containing protein [Streptomyces sp. AK02-01A]MDX3854225.1 pentapeptide repeat-containing protein [Streptomyces sp. AK02-01A]
MAVLAGVVAVVFTPVGRWMACWVSGQDWALMDIPARSAAVGQLRLATVQVTAATGAGAALIYTARTYQLARRGQVTDRFTKALERLSSDKTYVRIGGILALEQIVHDAPDQGGQAARVLNVFLRHQAPTSKEPGALAGAGLPDKPAEEIQEALRALTRPLPPRTSSTRVQIDLSRCHLAGAQLQGADLTGAVLEKASLARVDLTGAQSKGADFTDTDLSEAILLQAKGLEPSQLLRARYLRGCALPPEIAANAEIAQRVTEGP